MSEIKTAMEKIPYEEMVRLWCIEKHPDSVIAETHELKKDVVTRLRTEKYGISLYSIQEHIEKVKAMEMTTREEANAIVAFAFRNGFIEDLHAGEYSEVLENEKFSRITDVEMKKLMIQACEKVEELLRMKDLDETEYRRKMAAYGRQYCKRWEK